MVIRYARVGLFANRRNLGDEPDAFSEEELLQRPEVKIINKYVVFMAYIRIGLKGIGALALLWGTVVLLGGFVTKLTNKDFWFLTSIALVQAAGLSDAMGDDRFAFFGEWIISLKRKIRSLGNMTYRERLRWPRKRRAMKVLLHALHIIMFSIFAPVAYFAIGGPAICVVLSALRVAKQDYVVDKDKPDLDIANLKPALNLFYYVSLIHGAIFILYMVAEVVFDEALVDTVSRHHGLIPEVLDGYLHETKRMCVNNPGAIESWSLITYGACLLDSQLPEDYASGGRVLAMLIDQDTPVPITRMLIRSPRQRIQKLIGSLAWRSPDEREMRWLAARIVEHTAGHLNLAQFPGALECISSLLDTSCHNNGDQEFLCLPFEIGRSKPRKRRSFLRETLDGFVQEDEHGYLNVLRGPSIEITSILVELIYRRYLAPTNGGTLEQDSKQRENGEGIDEDLVLPGLRILENLAHDRHNCTSIYNTKDLLSKVVAPICSDKLVEHIKNNAAWTKVVDRSLKVVSLLMESPGSTGEEMRSLIADDPNAVNNLEDVLDKELESNTSIIKLRMQAINVLAQLVMHHPASCGTQRREKLVESVLDIFLTKDWMEGYLKHEKGTIDRPTTSQQNTFSRPSMRTRSYNHVPKVSPEEREREKISQRAAEARAEKKMKEAQETASRLKEKAGEALAMLSSDSEVIKSFTGCEAVALCLTELLDSKIKTIKCEISTTDTMEIEIKTGCRISAAVFLKNLSSYIEEPTSCKVIKQVLKELLPIQAEVTSTPAWWERVTGCIPSRRNDIENPIDGGQGGAFVKQSHIQQCGERRLQAELLSLVAAIRASRNVDFPSILFSEVTLEDFVVGLKKMVEHNMYATPSCLAILKLACKMVIDIIPYDQDLGVMHKHNIVGTLLEASKKMVWLESSMLFAGSDHDCHGVRLKPFSSDLAKQAEDHLKRRERELANRVSILLRLPVHRD